MLFLSSVKLKTVQCVTGLQQSIYDKLRKMLIRHILLINENDSNFDLLQNF